jgi:uncharacterized paraquat-inducible protein A
MTSLILNLAQERTMNKALAIILLITSLGCLIPGVMMPVLSLNSSTNIDAKVKSFSVGGVEKSRSILGTVKELFEEERRLVAVAIFAFSILVPITKIILMLMFYFVSEAKRIKIKSVVDAIGKWSMADVFVVAIILVFLSMDGGGSVKEFEVSFIGMILPVKVQSTMVSELRPGFYFFFTYCILRIISSGFLKLEAKKNTTAIS